MSSAPQAPATAAAVPTASTPAATSAPPQSEAPQAPRWEIMVVKQVLSGDSIIVREKPRGGPPAEKQINLSNVLAPKLARRPANDNSEEPKDEPWAWESREFLRKKIIGEDVLCTCERAPNTNRDYGQILLGTDPSTAINITELMVAEGWLNLRENRSQSEEHQKLQQLLAAAKSAGKGMWSNAPAQDHVRNIKWTQDDARSFQMKSGRKPIKAIIEHVRDGSTIRAFLLPDFNYITLMISGIRCPGYKLDQDGKPDPNVHVPFLEEARFFVESRLLQRDVEIILESVNNKNYVGSILYPKGNIAESLLREGFAKCVDWSMPFVTTGAERLRSAEQQAKEGRRRLWQDYQQPAQTVVGKEKDFSGTVVEIFSAEGINVKTANGVVKKVFLSSIRPPRDSAKTEEEEGKPAEKRTKQRPLYDIPWMFEAREFLRKKLVGKKVQCNLDYISPARENFPQKCCYTVMIGQSNVAETLVQKGLATVVRYRNDDDQRSCRYDDLISAEHQAIKGVKGVHGNKKDVQTIRINDLTVDHSRIKHQYLPSWQRALRTDAIVEFVASGSRFRLYIPRDSCLVTFLLGGISCPRSSRPALNGSPAQEGEPFGDEALAFTRDKILQRDVSVHIETTDKNGTSVIGWLWVDNVNLSVALVEEGLATVHFSAEKSEYYRALKTAEDTAKTQRKKRWLNYVEETVEEKKDDDKEEHVVERKVTYEEIIITEITPELHFFAQHTDKGANLEALMAKMRQEFQLSPPLGGAYTPKRNELCAARFTLDNEWYRAKVERIQGGNATVLYVDYGNKETLPTSRLALLPHAFTSDKPYANEYALALCRLPSDAENKEEACRGFAQDTLNKTLALNVEYRVNNFPHATLMSLDKTVDIGRGLITDGLVHADKRNERRLAKLVAEYKESEESAKKSRLGIWEYGDVEEDDTADFGR